MEKNLSILVLCILVAFPAFKDLKTFMNTYHMEHSEAAFGEFMIQTIIQNPFEISLLALGVIGAVYALIKVIKLSRKPSSK